MNAAASTAAKSPQSASLQADVPEVGLLAARIARLADGNAAQAADVRVLCGVAETRAVRLGMTVTIGWASTSQTYAGQIAASGSRCCSDADDVAAYFADVCERDCQGPSASKEISDQIALSHIGAFETFTDGYLIRHLSHRAHVVMVCDGCGGDGQVRCNYIGCLSGRTPCSRCGMSGREKCSGCQGTRYFTVSGEVRSCERCGGSGLGGACVMCHGNCWEQCPRCRGHGTLDCGACSGSGRRTTVYSSHLTGKVARTIGFDKDAPDGFRRSCRAVEPLSALARTTGKMVRSEVDSKAGQVSLTLHCAIRHVHADMRCRDVNISLDALGTALAVPLMPPFLDKLVGAVADDIMLTAAREPGHALGLASKTRLTRDILARVGGGRTPDASIVAARWQGAASKEFVDGIHACLQGAYSRAARSSVRRAWALMMPVLAIGAALANAYHLPVALTEYLRPRTATLPPILSVALTTLCECAAVLPIVGCAWVVAGRVGRRKLRAGMGDLARRAPRQGFWPWVGLAMAVMTGWGALALRLDAGSLGLPSAPTPSSEERTAPQASSAMAAGVPHAPPSRTGAGQPGSLAHPPTAQTSRRP